MKNVTLSLLAAAAIGAISIGSVSAMPVNNLAGLGENHFQDVRLVCDRFGRCYNTRRAYRPYYAQGYYGQCLEWTMVHLDIRCLAHESYLRQNRRPANPH